MKLRVWHNCQVGSVKNFYVPVDSIEEAWNILNTLWRYDLFQYENRIKPDYCNTGGLQVYNPEVADYEDWYLETDDDYFDDVDDYIESIGKADEIDEFTHELFKQIDWDLIHKING